VQQGGGVGDLRSSCLRGATTRSGFGAPARPVAGAFSIGAVQSAVLAFGAGGPNAPAPATVEFGLMMDMDLLHHIYHFDGRDLPSDQSEEICLKLCSIFACFAKEMVRYL